jgi:hypothetical protein
LRLIRKKYAAIRLQRQAVADPDPRRIRLVTGW